MKHLVITKYIKECIKKSRNSRNRIKKEILFKKEIIFKKKKSHFIVYYNDDYILYFMNNDDFTVEERMEFPKQ